MSRIIDSNHRYLDLAESVLSYKFTDRRLLVEALTHPSMRFELKAGEPDNQRLEFLGDAVMQLFTAHTIFHENPTTDEGGMTKLRANIVSTRGLASVARQWNLGACLFMTRSEEETGGRERESALADALEALMGAVYLDGGFDVVMGVAKGLFAQSLEHYSAQVLVDDGNPKGQLQELTQLVNAGFPSYEIVSDGGPDHDKSFSAQAMLEGRVIGVGSGRTKRQAEAEAARNAILNEAFVKEIELRRRVLEVQNTPNLKPKKKNYFQRLRGTRQSERH